MKMTFCDFCSGMTTNMGSYKIVFTKYDNATSEYEICEICFTVADREQAAKRKFGLARHEQVAGKINKEIERLKKIK